MLDTTQGLILEKHRRDFVCNFFLRLDNSPGSAAKNTLASIPFDTPSVADLQSEGEAIRQDLNAKQLPARRGPVCFMGFSSKGLEALGFDQPVRREFKEGFYSRANNALTVPNKQWSRNWTQDRVDAILICAADTPESLAAVNDELIKHFAANSGVRILFQEAASIERQPSIGPQRGLVKENFGFSDGVSQPALLPGTDPRNYNWKSSFDPTASLDQIVFPDMLAPAGSDRFGSYMAYVRIQQNVPRFRDATDNLAHLIETVTGLRPDHGYSAAMIIGREQDGKPLIGGQGGHNDFDRQSDPNGTHWPMGSHISKMNPRDGRSRPVILRRSVPYKDGDEVGILFQSFQSALDQQFERLFSVWSQDNNLPVIGAGADPILGNRQCPAAMGSVAPKPGNPMALPVCISQLTAIRGGEYFYFPSIPSIRPPVVGTTHV